MWTVKETAATERNTFIAPAGSDFYKIVDESGKTDKWTYATPEQAQKRADALNTPDEDVFDIFFDDDTSIDYYGPNTEKEEVVQPQTEPEEEIMLDGRYEVGQQIQVDGAGYIIEETFYVSAEDAAMLEDANDASISVGWHANARIKR